MRDAARILETAARLSRAVGKAPPLGVKPLAGGRNNQVFRVDYGTDEQAAALKRYYFGEDDRRDRLGAEWEFLNYAWARGVRAVPQPLAHDPETRCALYSYVAGEPFRAGDIGRSDVDAAADFIQALNASPREIAAFRSGSEACFSLADHIGAVDRRVSRLGSLDADAPHSGEAALFVRQDLQPAWRDIRARILRDARAAGLDPSATLGENAICLSPSDFGFHNAIRAADGSVAFLDFEYAGRDDPAKLVCDFFCQPEVPVPLEFWKRFGGRIIADLGLGAEHQARFDLLLDAYRIKWICIVLNEFLATGAARRRHAAVEATEQHYAAQIALARSQFQRLMFGAV